MAELSNSLLLPLIDDIKRAAEAAPSRGPEGHAELLRRINDCLIAAETPLETIRRIGYQVRNDCYLRWLLSSLFSRFDSWHSRGKMLLSG